MAAQSRSGSLNWPWHGKIEPTPATTGGELVWRVILMVSLADNGNRLKATPIGFDPIVAAIDIGTNSIHMVVVKIQSDLPAFTILTREKDTVRLGDRDPKTGHLTPEAIDRALAALRRCQEIIRSFNVKYVVAAATSATREAPNGREFLRQVKKELGLSVSLISGQEEARRIYLGMLSGMELEGRLHAIVDIGGGSTEIILGDGREPRSLSSTKVGAVRLSRKFVTTDPISDGEFQYLQAYIRGMLERPAEELRSHLQPGETLQLVGTSGTIECLAQIHAAETLGTIPNPLNGYQLSFEGLQNVIKKLRKLNYQERVEVPGMSAKRAEIIVPGAIILQEAMRLLEADSIVICERALREGLVVDWMLTHGLINDRLAYQGSVRERSVYKIALKYQVNLESSQRMADFAVKLFDDTRGILHEWGEEERELLWAAAILHNCGVHVSHAAHHKHSYYLIRYGELLGYTEIEIEIIANLARYHRKSLPKKNHDAYQALSKTHRQLVDELSALLRLAIALDRRQIGAIARIESEVREDEQEFVLSLHPTNPGDPCELERWNLDYKKEAFETVFDLTLAVNLIGAKVGVFNSAG